MISKEQIIEVADRYGIGVEFKKPMNGWFIRDNFGEIERNDMNKEEIKINDVEVESFRNNNETDVIILSWQGNIGWGEYTLYKEKGSDQWKADSECMDRGDDKSFLKMLLRKFVENVEVK